MNLENLFSSDAHWNINKALSRIIGLTDTVLLMELYFCRKRFKKAEFFITAEELKELLPFGDDERRNCTQRLIKRKMITVVKKGLPAKNYYTIDDDEIFKTLTTSDAANGSTGDTDQSTTSDAEDGSANTLKKELKNKPNKEEENSSLPPNSMEAKWLRSFTSENADRDLDRAIKETYNKEMNQMDFFQVYSEYWQDYNKRHKTKVLVNINYATRLWSALKYDDRESILKEMRDREEQYFKGWWWNTKKRPFTQQELVEFWDQLAPVKKEEPEKAETLNRVWDPKDEARVRDILEALKGRAYDDPEYDLLNNEKKQIINKYTKPK